MGLCGCVFVWACVRNQHGIVSQPISFLIGSWFPSVLARDPVLSVAQVWLACSLAEIRLSH